MHYYYFYISNKTNFMFIFACILNLSIAIKNIQTLSYEERIELWNLENEQFEELIIQPTLNY